MYLLMLIGKVRAFLPCYKLIFLSADDYMYVLCWSLLKSIFCLSSVSNFCNIIMSFSPISSYLFFFCLLGTFSLCFSLLLFLCFSLSQSPLFCLSLSILLSYFTFSLYLFISLSPRSLCLFFSLTLSLPLSIYLSTSAHATVLYVYLAEEVACYDLNYWSDLHTSTC